MLSVVAETKREESLYEPVSPTPLPDSPVEEVKPSPASEDKPGSPVPADDGFIEARSRKKKSAATKKAELNRKGMEKEQNKDLLEVFMDGSAPTKKTTAEEPAAKLPTPPKEQDSEPVKPKEPEFKEPTPPKAEPLKVTVNEFVPRNFVAEKTPEPVSAEVVVPEPEIKTNGIDAVTAGNHAEEEDVEEVEEGEIVSDTEEEMEGKTKLKYEYKVHIYNNFLVCKNRG